MLLGGDCKRSNNEERPETTIAGPGDANIFRGAETIKIGGISTGGIEIAADGISTGGSETDIKVETLPDGGMDAGSSSGPAEAAVEVI